MNVLQPTVDLSGKVALVTGAGSGIGRAASVEYARAGAAVMCADINVDGAKVTSETIGKEGGHAAALPLDVRDESAVETSLQQTIDALGGFDILFNNAGVGNVGYETTLQVNQNGVYFGLKHGAALLAERGGGAIVNTSSIAGIQGLADPSGMLHGTDSATMELDGVVSYVASKHAVVGMTRQFAIHYAPQNVRVNAVAPGYIETPLTAAMRQDPAVQQQYEELHPMNRLGRPEEIATAVVFLSSDAASFITGHVLAVDGGYSCR
ncbi:MAG: SDR family NAD(P)-dependent oxidoreductase [Rhodospirillaceae bacterium]|nr:SDR family NAD(P)-dependent oxidoreductase [Rhodospirillaceae bacterium]